MKLFCLISILFLLFPKPVKAKTVIYDDFTNVVFLNCYDGDTCYFDIPSQHDIIGKRIGIRIKGIDQDTSMIPLDLSDYTPKQRRVIETAHLKIPVGEFYSYGQVAEMADLIGAFRFVGTTMKKSRTPWIIPCQRVKSSSWIKKYKRDMKRGSLL